MSITAFYVQVWDSCYQAVMFYRQMKIHMNFQPFSEKKWENDHSRYEIQCTNCTQGKMLPTTVNEGI